MRFHAFCLLVLLLFPLTCLGSNPSEAVASASLDVSGLPATVRAHVRYVSAYHVPEKDQKVWKAVLDGWVNSLSKESELKPLAEVSPRLYRLDLRDYQINPKVWEKLADAEPYFHAKIKLEEFQVVKELWPGGVWPDDGKVYPAGSFYVEKKVKKEGSKIQTAQAPWLPVKEIKNLVELTGSQVPIVRGDWFLVQTAQQTDRKGAGYYDFLGAKNRKEFQEIVGLDQKAAEKLQKEIRSIVARSGVALNNRQIIRFATITGSYWVTLDVKNSQGERNAVRNLNGDYKHDAEEIYGVLPNGLFAFFLSDEKGERQDTAPDFIASDGKAPGNDKRVHSGVSCVRCHVEGIRPIDDWARKVYRPPLALGSPDYDKLRRLQRLYLGELEKWIKRDQQDYEETLLKITGMKALEFSKAFAKVHEYYQEADLTLKEISLESGCTPEHLLAALKWYVKVNGSLDPLLAGLLKERPETIRREHFEEVYSLLQTVLRGYAP